MSTISKYFPQAGVLSDDDDFILDSALWSKQIFLPSRVDDQNPRGFADSGVSYSYIQRVQITPGLIEICSDSGVSLDQIVAAYESLVVTEFVPHVLRNDAFKLTDVIGGPAGGVGGFYSLKAFVSDCWRISDDSLLSRGIKDPGFYRTMAVAYFVVNHRFDRLGYSAIDWHKVVETIGYKDFFNYLALGLDIDFTTIKRFADDGIDFEIAKTLLMQSA